MSTYKIKYGLNGGFGGIENKDWEIIDADSEDEARDIAYNLAIEEYERMVGNHGLRTLEDIMEEDGLDEDDAEQQYDEERENWLDYCVEKV